MTLPSSLLAEPEPFDDLPPKEHPVPLATTLSPVRTVPTLAEAALRVRPTTLAVERILPVLPALVGLVPDGLRRGSSLGVSGPGARSLAMALMAGTTSAGSWAAVVGDPDLGLVAAGEAGVALERLAIVTTPEPSAWGDVVGALVGSLDLVVVAPQHRVGAATVRRLMARVRERGSVLIRVGDGPWPDRFDLTLTVVDGSWEGHGSGHGRLLLRRAEVLASGRRAASRERRVAMMLPSPDGSPASS
ncbi:MAG TPA: hypothetical protein QGF85_07025, partial [Acidimicrobiales bacterium]|nr:hypothetical protein [Acidimicrobiales bacterium]